MAKHSESSALARDRPLLTGDIEESPYHDKTACSWAGMPAPDARHLELYVFTIFMWRNVVLKQINLGI
ncbi:MAG TPA: hypothetical protein VF544_18440 [Pyrinomonadaceae bacterium]|jgi:hypothetical protein